MAFTTFSHEQLADFYATHIVRNILLPLYILLPLSRCLCRFTTRPLFTFYMECSVIFLCVI
ncbi:unnamed protein product [Meloidogyne enterolobii]|uniref:Uncharacterized protein n=1 Tax=Meloidogyne enterolobii TaxID=390850 RepID=A0ACB1A7S1_MELEN